MIEEEFENNDLFGFEFHKIRDVVHNCTRWLRDHPDWYDSSSPVKGQKKGKK